MSKGGNQPEKEATNPSNAPDSTPLFVDLDGTVIKSDLLIEGLLALVRQAPLSLFRLPFWLMRGIKQVKVEVANRVVMPIERIPVQEEFIEFLRKEAAYGRPIYLATAANRLLAEQVADRIGVFSGVLASDERENLKGWKKLEAIRESFPGPFDYAGNSRSDLKIWSEARSGIVVNPGPGICEAARRRCRIAQVFEDRASSFSSWFRALRIYQWMKNLLLGVPLLTAHAFSPNELGAATVAFVAFGLVASSTYLINDLFDLGADRSHPRKRKRPFAAGDISLKTGLAAIIAFLGIGFFLSGWLPKPFRVALLAYAGLTLGYSSWFKTVALLDVILLAALHTVRIIAGAAAIEVEVSSWLLAFSMFVFLSIALVKRTSELVTVGENSQTETVGRDYRLSDYAVLNAMGIASGYLSVLVLALFIDSPGVPENYTHPGRLWLLCPLMLYWVSRLWIKTARGEMPDDPLLFSLKDWVSWMVLLAMVLVTLTAI
ncbi:MAG: UbiA family prenyltransferase [Desulfobacterales bacterium]